VAEWYEANTLVGWVRVEFESSGAPPVPVDDGEYVLRIPRSGLLKTSSAEQYGWLSTVGTLDL
jgi:hypothetical protein